MISRGARVRQAQDTGWSSRVTEVGMRPGAGSPWPSSLVDVGAWVPGGEAVRWGQGRYRTGKGKGTVIRRFRCHPGLDCRTVTSHKHGRPDGLDIRASTRNWLVSSIKKGGWRQPGSFWGAFDSEAAASCSEPRVKAGCWGLQSSKWRHLSGCQVSLKSWSRQALCGPTRLGMWPGLATCVLIEPPCSWPPQHFKEGEVCHLLLSPYSS